MNQYKSIFASTSFWGSVVSFLGLFAPKAFIILGFTNDPSGQALLVGHIISIIGVVTAIYGRFTATAQTTLTGAPPAGKEEA